MGCAAEPLTTAVPRRRGGRRVRPIITSVVAEGRRGTTKGQNRAQRCDRLPLHDTAPLPRFDLPRFEPTISTFGPAKRRGHGSRDKLTFGVRCPYNPRQVVFARGLQWKIIDFSALCVKTALSPFFAFHRPRSR